MSEAFSQSDLQGVVEDVLEKMFFASVIEDRGSVDHADASEVAAQLRFEGDPPGEFLLKVTSESARSIAADFLGEDESAISSARVEEVICELANMLCGSLLSRSRNQTIFRLSSPSIVSSATIPISSDETVHVVGLAKGQLSMHVWLDETERQKGRVDGITRGTLQ